jgi:hypothetical protein
MAICRTGTHCFGGSNFRRSRLEIRCWAALESRFRIILSREHRRLLEKAGRQGSQNAFGAGAEFYLAGTNSVRHLQAPPALMYSPIASS